MDKIQNIQQKRWKNRTKINLEQIGCEDIKWTKMSLNHV
jgi:hypothetical protein